MRAHEYLRKLADDIETGRHGDVVSVIPVVVFRRADGADMVGTLNHGAALPDKIRVCHVLLDAMHGLLFGEPKK